MKILHVYPALAAVLEAPRVIPETVTVECIVMRVYRKTNVYMDTRARVTRYEGYAQDTYFLEVLPDVFVRVGCAVSDEAMRDRLTRTLEFGPQAGSRPIDGVPEFIAQHASIANDIEGYNAHAIARIATKKAERETEDARRNEERAKKEAEQIAAYQLEVEEAKKAFRAGDYVSFDHFETMCREFGITIPLRTLGACRKNVTRIGNGRISVCNGSKPDAAFRIANQLHKALSAAS